MNRGFGLFIVIAVTLLYTGHALTTEDLLLAENSKNAVPITSLAESGAVNQPPSAKSLTPDVDGPETAGTTIVWTGKAYDPDGDRMLYQFWLNGPSTGNTWKPMTNWNESNTWNWTTSPVDIGNNIIDLRIRDNHHSGPWGWDSHISADYAIESLVGAEGRSKVNDKPSILGIRSDRQSPQDKAPRLLGPLQHQILMGILSSINIGLKVHQRRISGWLLQIGQLAIHGSGIQRRQWQACTQLKPRLEMDTTQILRDQMILEWLPMF